MKKRYRKHIEKLIRKSPIIAFTKEKSFQKGNIINKDDFTLFSEYMGLNNQYLVSSGYKEIKEEMYSNLLRFTDNYLLCGGNKDIYVLIPLKDGSFKIVEKETIAVWSEEYWKKEDPQNTRDWCYPDEDSVDLLNYIMIRFNKYLKS